MIRTATEQDYIQQERLSSIFKPTAKTSLQHFQTGFPEDGVRKNLGQSMKLNTIPYQENNLNVQS